mgnify:CR=1 FL=1
MSYDVIIVGAGPSGSTAARYIASMDFRVLVLEKEKTDREKACAGGISGRVIKEFGVPDRAFDRMIYGDFICSPQYVTVNLEKPYRIGACAMRGKFDKILCEIAMDEGAEFREESKVVDPILKDKALVGVRSREKGEIRDYRAKVTVIADGNLSGMSRKLGVYIGDPHAIFLCYQQQMKLPNSKIDERIGNNIEIYFGSAIIPIGYAWIFPKDGMVSVGLGAPLYIVKEERINLRERLKNFIKHHPVAKEKLLGAEVSYSQAALIPHGNLGAGESKIVSQIYGNGYIIVGDAAGFVSPATGEGIYYGMKSGKLAAEAVVDSFEIEDFSEKILAGYYEKILESIVYEDMKFGWTIRRMFLESDGYTEKLVRASKADPWFGEMTRKLISGEIPYGRFLRTLYTHPHKLIKALLYY